MYVHSLQSVGETLEEALIRGKLEQGDQELQYTDPAKKEKAWYDYATDIFSGAKGLYDNRVAGQARERALRELALRRRGGAGGDFMSKYGLMLAAGGVGLVLVLVLTRK